MADNKQLLFERVNAHAKTRDYLNRQPIFAQGDKADSMFCIQNGNVKLTVTEVG